MAIYARISEDESGLEAGVTRQLADARQLAQRRGWTVVAERSDNNVSAFSGKVRPGYVALMEDVETGRVDRIVVFHTSRLWRNRRERADGIERLQRARVSVAAVKGPELDLSTAYGRGMAGLLGEFDSMESEVKSERIERAALQRAESGNPNGAVPFGWTRVVETNERGVRTGARDVLHPDEAPIVREVVDRLLAGQSLIAVTAWLNETGVPAPGAKFNVRNRGRGITNPTGEKWAKSSVKKLALRAQNAGLRQYHKGAPDERILPMKADPIISRDEWERLKAMFADPEAKRGKPGMRKHLLSWGIGKCGICGSVLRVAKKQGKYGKPVIMYVCDAKGCVGRKQENVDLLIKAVMIERLKRADVRELLIADDGQATESLNRAEGLRARLNTAADDYAEGLINADQLRRITAKLTPEIERSEREAADARPDVPVGLLAQVAGEKAEAEWDRLDVGQRRRLVSVFVSAVRIDRSRQGPGFDPCSVRIDWV